MTNFIEDKEAVRTKESSLFLAILLSEHRV